MITPKILFVKDDAVVAEQATIALQRLGYSVVPAELDCDIIHEVGKHVPQLVLWDATNTAYKMQTEEGNCVHCAVDIPIVLLAAATVLDAAEQHNGHTHILTTPHEDDLKAAIEEALHKHSAQRGEMRQRERVLHAALAVVADAVVHVDSQGVIRFFNASAERLTGMDARDVLGMPFADAVQLRCTDNSARPVSLSLYEGQPQPLPDNVCLIQRDTTPISIVGTVSAAGETNDGVLVVFREGSDRHGSSREEDERHFNEVYDEFPAIMHLIDEHGCICNANRRWLEVLGYTREEVVGRSIFSLMVKSSAERLQSVLLQEFWDKKEVYNLPCQFVTKNGDIVETIINGNICHTAAHRRIGRMVLQNISEQKQTEQALVENQRKYRDLIRNVPIAIMRFLVKENKYEFVNDEFERQSGYTLAEVEQFMDDDLIAMIHVADQNRVFTFFRDWQKQGYQGVERIAYRILSKNGSTIWLDSYMYADCDTKGNAIAINQICVDISELKRAESVLNDTLREEFQRTIQNLQNLVFKLYLLPNGDYAYSLREGKLAGEFTTTVVRGKRPADIYGKDHDALVRSYILRAFAGESISFSIEVSGKWLVYSLEPLIEDGNVVEVVGSAVDITHQKNTERRLFDSERKFRVLVENLPIAIAQNTVYPDGTVRPQYVNPEYERQVGYTLEDGLTIPRGQLANLCHPDDRTRVLSQWINWKNSTTDTSLYQLFRLQDKSGEYRWFDSYAIKYTADDGTVSVIEAVLDVTEQKTNDEHLRRLASFPEQDPNPIIETDTDGKVLYVNPTARTLFPTILEQQQEHPVLAWVLEKADVLLEQPGEVVSREISINGEVYEQAVFYLPEVQLLRIFCYRITERKRAEEQLRKALVKERELNSLKTRFVTTVSHEFRTPLTGILMSADIMERYGDRLSDEDWVREVDKIKKRVNELTELMNDFLLQSSAESMGHTFRPVVVDIGEVCENVIRDYLFVASSSMISLQCDIASDVQPVIGDPKLLRLVVQNLISNAVKYSFQGAPVTVQVHNGNGNGHVVLSVVDQGIGIPAEEVPRLFTPFYRATNAAKIPGTGIGLSIVKEFVDLHNGTIGVQSEVGKGAVFTVLLPAIQEEA